MAAPGSLAALRRDADTWLRFRRAAPRAVRMDERDTPPLSLSAWAPQPRDRSPQARPPRALCPGRPLHAAAVQTAASEAERAARASVPHTTARTHARQGGTSTVSAVAALSCSSATISFVTAAMAASVSVRLGCCMHCFRSTWCTQSSIERSVRLRMAFAQQTHAPHILPSACALSVPRPAQLSEPQCRAVPA